MLLFPLFVFYLMHECPAAASPAMETGEAQTRHAKRVAKRRKAARKALLFCTLLSTLSIALAACASRFCIALAGALLIWLSALLVKMINWLFEVITLSQDQRPPRQASNDEATPPPRFAEDQNLTTLACSFKSARPVKSSAPIVKIDPGHAEDSGSDGWEHSPAKTKR